MKEQDYLEAGRSIRRRGEETGANNYGFADKYVKRINRGGKETLAFLPAYKAEIGQPPADLDIKANPKAFVAYTKGLVGG